ncbi:non-canonical purine NTP pyrophosphatase [Flavihumibacter sp. R14]|nr:non-canonical purine NTP pyrophosphatase [Flavihumibacter soli]
MKKLYFNTINSVKVREITEIFKDYSDEVGFLDNNVTEILSANLDDVIKAKAAQAYRLAKVPVIVEHGGLEIEFLNNYPSALSKPMWDMLGDKICELIPPLESRKAVAKSAVCYCDGRKYVICFGETPGQISKKGLGDNGFQWDPIFIPEGSTKTYAEMEQTEKLQFSQAMKAYTALRKKLNLF